MVEAGCIVFVPDNGGQVEIVNHPDLVYEGVLDAADKIDRVLSNHEAQDTLREHLTKGVQKFSVENFKKGIRGVVSDFVQGKRT
jgi:glycosyltransferase involved in cell wall biosynthesis